MPNKEFSDVHPANKSGRKNIEEKGEMKKVGVPDFKQIPGDPNSNVAPLGKQAGLKQ